jgi:acyl dehydratase
VVGLHTEAIAHHVDRRWLMAYAAGLQDDRPVHTDPTRAGGIIGHPLFPVCVEWPTVLAVRHLGPLEDALNADEARRAVHATHDLSITRPVRPDDQLRTTATITGVERRRPGAFLTMELLTVDAAGAEVCRTRQGSLYLGVDVDGPDRPAPPPPRPSPAAGSSAPAGEALVAVDRPIGAGAAHVYTECARIWNPIHTDRAIARAAGLDDIILHGTASLAHGVTAAVTHLAGGDPTRLRHISGRFGAMVPMPSTLTVRLFADHRFEVSTPDGARAVRDGFLVID